MFHYAEIKRDRAGQWRYTVRAMNHERIAQSEGYTRRWSALRAVRRNHPDVGRVDLFSRAGAFKRSV